MLLGTTFFKSIFKFFYDRRLKWVRSQELYFLGANGRNDLRGIYNRQLQYPILGFPEQVLVSFDFGSGLDLFGVSLFSFLY